MQSAATTYKGNERRHHQVYITQNTEYHVRSGQVVGVRRRGVDGWLGEHAALSMRVVGSVQRGMWVPSDSKPQAGDRLYLAHSKNDVVTSPVLEIARPPKNVVSQYPSTSE
jgi:hypothetical protein